MANAGGVEGNLRTSARQKTGEWKENKGRVAQTERSALHPRDRALAVSSHEFEFARLCKLTGHPSIALSLIPGRSQPIVFPPMARSSKQASSLNRQVAARVGVSETRARAHQKSEHRHALCALPIEIVGWARSDARFFLNIKSDTIHASVGANARFPLLAPMQHHVSTMHPEHSRRGLLVEGAQQARQGAHV